MDTGGIRLDRLEQILLGDQTAGDHSPTEVGRFCTKPLTFLTYLGGLKLPCIDSAQRQKQGWGPYSQRGQVAGGLQVALPGQGRAHGEGEPSFSGAAVRTS